MNYCAYCNHTVQPPRKTGLNTDCRHGNAQTHEILPGVFVPLPCAWPSCVTKRTARRLRMWSLVGVVFYERVADHGTNYEWEPWSIVPRPTDAQEAAVFILHGVRTERPL